MKKRCDQIAEGIALLSKYDPSGFGVCAEHDQIWAGPDDTAVVSPDDQKTLEHLFWFIDEEAGRWSFFP